MQIPITAMIINKAAVLSGLTSQNKPRQFHFFGSNRAENIPAQIRESHPTATIGTKTLARRASWYIK